MSRLVIRIALVVTLGLCAFRGWQEWSPSARDPWFWADTWYSLGIYDRAIPAYAQAMGMQPYHPRVPEAAYRIACCHHDLGHHRQALQALEAFLVQYPTHPLRPTIEGELQYYPIAYVETP